MRYKLCVRYAVFSMHFASIVSFVPGFGMLMTRHFQLSKVISFHVFSNASQLPNCNLSILLMK